MRKTKSLSQYGTQGSRKLNRGKLQYASGPSINRPSLINRSEPPFLLKLMSTMAAGGQTD
jgi:hypothetical protein